MFTQQQIEHFKAFGFVLARHALTDEEARALRREVQTELTAAFGGIGTDTDPDCTGGIRGDYLPLTVDRAPLSQALTADDPRLFQGSAELLGRLTVPTAPIAVCFTSNAGWHTDDGRGIGGVKFIAYLEPRRAETGALRVIPGSHTPALASRLASYWSQDPAASGFQPWPVPHVALETEPGDVIAFDVALFHSSDGGDKRLAWMIEYLPWPGLGDADRLRAVRDAVVETVDYEGYDRERWPTWREWAANPSARPPSRQTALERLRLLGVIERSGLEAGAAPGAVQALSSSEPWPTPRSP